jgi:hypothetical protein
MVAGNTAIICGMATGTDEPAKLEQLRGKFATKGELK